MINNTNNDLQIQGSFSTRKRALLFFIVHFLFFIIHLKSHAQIDFKKDYFTVYDFKNDWLVYDQSYKDYVPFVAQNNISESALSVLIDIESNRKYDLLIYVKKDNYLFLDASLNQRLKPEVWTRIPIDSLFQVYKKPQILVTFYGTAGIDDKTVLVAHRKSNRDEKLINIADESFLSLRPRNISPLNDFFTISLFLIILTIALLFGSFGRAFSRFTDVRDLFITNVKDEFLVNRPLSRVNVVFILLLSIEVSFIYFFVRSKNYYLFSTGNFLANEQILIQNLWTLLKIIALVFGLYIVKYFALYLFSSLYRLDSVVNIHYFKVLQSSLIFFTVVLFGISVASFYVVDWQAIIKNTIIYPAIIFYISRILLLYFTIKNSVLTKNLYLISYLCIAELIPLIIGIRYAL
jgi:uncharacterized membrane protein YidH (DUF202 family)